MGNVYRVLEGKVRLGDSIENRIDVPTHGSYYQMSVWLRKVKGMTEPKNKFEFDINDRCE